MDEPAIEFIDDIRLYERHRPKPTTEIIMGPVVQEGPILQEEKSYYHRPELFDGQLPIQTAFLPPPDTTPVIQIPQPNITDLIDGMNCRDVAVHIKRCPVCSRLHKSNNYIYAAIIVVLIILCVFLGRRFFE